MTTVRPTAATSSLPLSCVWIAEYVKGNPLNLFHRCASVILLMARSAHTKSYGSCLAQEGNGFSDPSGSGGTFNPFGPRSISRRSSCLWASRYSGTQIETQSCCRLQSFPCQSR